MRKALGLAILGCALVLGFACSGDSSSPTTATVLSTSDLQSITGAVKPAKDLICHWNATDDPYGVVVEVSGKNAKRHADHDNDCDITCPGLQPNEQCDPGDCTC